VELGPIVDSPESSRQISMLQHTFLQYARRCIFHEPVLSLKALDKVSFKDLFLDEDFSVEDAALFIRLFEMRLGFGLLWWKDSVREAMAIASPVGTAANVGDPSEYFIVFCDKYYLPVTLENRFKILGGWIFNRTHTGTLPNEAWWVSESSFGFRWLCHSNTYQLHVHRSLFNLWNHCQQTSRIALFASATPLMTSLGFSPLLHLA
jgi:hypothetical protein